MISLRHPKIAEKELVDPLRSKIMRAVKRAHTKPEVVVRQVLHRMGLRFRLQRKDLPGTPDIVLPKHRTAIFVHGCFWHRHEDCSKATMPKTRVEFWSNKFSQNVCRDQRNVHALETTGWTVLVVWECETLDQSALSKKLSAELKRESFS